MAQLPVDDGVSERESVRPSRRKSFATRRLFLTDLVLVLVSLVLLVTLGLSTGLPVFENLLRSRLTVLSLCICAVFLFAGVVISPLRLALSAVIDWAPVLGLFAVYENLKHMHANRITEWLGITPKDNLMASLDVLLFGAVLPLKLEMLSQDSLISVMWFFYAWVYYCGPAFLLGWTYFRLRDSELFAVLRHSLVLALLGGYVLYLLIPVAGPLFIMGDKFHVPIASQPVLANFVFDYRYNWDCFPSLHTAVPWLLTFLSWKRISVFGRCLTIFASSGVTASTVLLRFHYGIDLIAGLLWACLIFLLVTRSSGDPAVTKMIDHESSGGV
jgi:membrane-associated phospholipid phosphatase